MTATVKIEVYNEVFRESKICEDEITFDTRGTCKRTRRFVCDDMPLGKDNREPQIVSQGKFYAFARARVSNLKSIKLIERL